MNEPRDAKNPRVGGPEGFAKSTGQVSLHSIAALGTYTANRDRVLGKGRRAWLCNSLLDATGDDISRAIADLYEAHRLRGAA